MESIIITIAPFVQGICLGSTVTFIMCVAVGAALMWIANKKKKTAIPDAERRG